MQTRNDAGFALLEALVATAIFAAVLGALYGGLRNGWRAWGVATREEAALTLAKSLIATEGVETPLHAGARSGNAAGLLWLSETRPYEQTAGRDGKLSGYWVRTVVRWRDSGQGSPERSVTLVSLKVAPLEAQARP